MADGRTRWRAAWATVAVALAGACVGSTSSTGGSDEAQASMQVVAATTSGAATSTSTVATPPATTSTSTTIPVPPSTEATTTPSLEATSADVDTSGAGASSGSGAGAGGGTRVSHAAVDPLAALQAVDWRNGRYRVPCPGPELTEVQLVDGEYRPEVFGHYSGFAGAQYGEIGDPSGGDGRTAAAVVISCIGASHFPSTVLLYGVDADGSVVELGIVAGGPMTVTTTDPPYWWEADSAVFADGLLHVRGRGYSPRAGHCCPDYVVSAAYALGRDGPVKVAHSECRDLTVPTLPAD